MHRALAFLGLGLGAAAVLGIFGRRKATACLSFSVLMAASVGFMAFFLLFPKSYTPAAFLAKQGIYDSLLFGMSLELSFRVFSAFRGIAESARKILGGLVLLSTAAIFFLTPQATYSEFWRYQPSVTTAGIWCLTSVSLLIVWYQIPVAAFTRAIVMAYVPYQVVFVILTDIIRRRGWGVIPELNVANAAAYDVMVAYLAYAAWRKD